MTRPDQPSAVTDHHAPQRWSGWWIALHLLGGIAAALLTFAITLVSWHRCAVDPEAGGSFGIMFLFVTALIVMPLVGAATGITAVIANALLRRIPRCSRLSPHPHPHRDHSRGRGRVVVPDDRLDS